MVPEEGRDVDRALLLNFRIEQFREDPIREEDLGPGRRVFHVAIAETCQREQKQIPLIITRCVEEVEARGLCDVGIYRVSGLTTEMNQLSSAFDENSTTTDVKDVDINTVCSLLKQYLRQLPECLFTNSLYPQFLRGFYNLDMQVSVDSYDPDPDNIDPAARTMLTLFSSLPTINRTVVVYLLQHLVRVSSYEIENKMSLSNIATVFGPTLLHSDVTSMTDPCGILDINAQVGVLHFFLSRVARNIPIELPEYY